MGAVFPAWRTPLKIHIVIFIFLYAICLGCSQDGFKFIVAPSIPASQGFWTPGSAPPFNSSGQDSSGICARFLCQRESSCLKKQTKYLGKNSTDCSHIVG